MRPLVLRMYSIGTMATLRNLDTIALPKIRNIQFETSYGRRAFRKVSKTKRSRRSNVALISGRVSKEISIASLSMEKLLMK